MGVPALARLGPLMTEAKPAKDPIHIAACVDNSGFPSLYILLQSLKVTQNNNELHVSVLHNGLTKTRIQLIHEKFCGDGFTVEFIRVDPKEYFTGRPPYGLMAYARILLPDILKADRVLYIDTDIIVMDDLSDFFGSILHNCIGVVKTGIAGKSNCYSYLKERGFDYYDDYFNSGVILINCKKWRDENCTARLLRLGTLENWKFPTHDQTLLNAFFKGKFDALDKKYNYLCWSSATGSAIDEVVQNVMIHFIGRPKPWEFGGRLCFSYAIYIKLKRRMEMQAAPVEPADLWWSGRRIARYASSYGKLLKKRGINRYLHARKLIGVG